MDSEKLRCPEIWRTLDLAKNEIMARRPERALELIESARAAAEQSGVGALVVELRLLLAEAFGAKGDPVAEVFFSEALNIIAGLEGRHTELEMRAHEHFADFLVKFAARPLDARDHILAANRIAIREGLEKESIRLGLKTIVTY